MKQFFLQDATGSRVQQFLEVGLTCSGSRDFFTWILVRAKISFKKAWAIGLIKKKLITRNTKPRLGLLFNVANQDERKEEVFDHERVQTLGTKNVGLNPNRTRSFATRVRPLRGSFMRRKTSGTGVKANKNGSKSDLFDCEIWKCVDLFRAAKLMQITIIALSFPVTNEMLSQQQLRMETIEINTHLSAIFSLIPCL